MQALQVWFHDFVNHQLKIVHPLRNKLLWLNPGILVAQVHSPQSPDRSFPPTLFERDTWTQAWWFTKTTMCTFATI